MSSYRIVYTKSAHAIGLLENIASDDLAKFAVEMCLGDSSLVEALEFSPSTINALIFKLPDDWKEMLVASSGELPRGVAVGSIHAVTPRPMKMPVPTTATTTKPN